MRSSLKMEAAYPGRFVGKLFGSLAACSLISLGFLHAEIDKDAKKEAAGVEEGKDEKPAARPESHEELHQRLANESEANLKEIARLMKLIQEDLANKKTGDPTQVNQKEVVKKIEKLIEQVGKG